MAIIKKELGNQIGHIESVFKQLYEGHGIGGLASIAFADGWREAWKECSEQRGAKLATQAKEIAKLNIILYHRENGLSHPDFKAEIEISKQAEEIEGYRTMLQEVLDNIDNVADFGIHRERIAHRIERVMKGEEPQ